MGIEVQGVFVFSRVVIKKGGKKEKKKNKKKNTKVGQVVK